MRTRMLIAMILISLLCFSACSLKEPQSVEVCTEESALTDFYEADGIVHIVCRIKLRNNTGEDQTVKIMGKSQEDADGGLLEDPRLTGYHLEEQINTFLIPANSQAVMVVDFRGVYAGVLEKKDRLIPDEITIELLQTQESVSPAS